MKKYALLILVSSMTIYSCKKEIYPETQSAAALEYRDSLIGNYFGFFYYSGWTADYDSSTGHYILPPRSISGQTDTVFYTVAKVAGDSTKISIANSYLLGCPNCKPDIMKLAFSSNGNYHFILDSLNPARVQECYADFVGPDSMYFYFKDAAAYTSFHAFKGKQ
jgi:hypothetical protein